MSTWWIDPSDDRRGEAELAAHILRDGLDRDLDLAFSDELRIDHSATCPIIVLWPEADLPIVPVCTSHPHRAAAEAVRQAGPRTWETVESPRSG